MKIGLSSNLGPARLYLVHNGAQLPLELLLVALFAGVRDRKVVWFDELGTRLGRATLSLFILHWPVFYSLSRLLKTMRLYFEFGLGGGEMATYAQKLKNMPLDFSMYPLLLLLVIAIAVTCQKQFVLRLRKIYLAPWKRASLDVTKTAPQA